MPTARLARISDLGRLLDLFRDSEVSPIAEPPDRAERIWAETLAREGVDSLFRMRAPGSWRPACSLPLRIFCAAAVGTGSSKMSLPTAIFAGRGMVAPLFKL